MLLVFIFIFPAVSVIVAARPDFTSFYFLTPLAPPFFPSTQTDDSFIVSPDHLTSLFVPFSRLIVFLLAAPRTGRPDSAGSYHAFSAVRILRLSEIRMQRWEAARAGEAEIAINRINDGMNVLVRGRTLKR